MSKKPLYCSLSCGMIGWVTELFSSRRWRLYRPKQKVVVFILNRKKYSTHECHNSIVVWLLVCSSCSSPSTAELHGWVHYTPSSNEEYLPFSQMTLMLNGLAPIRQHPNTLFTIIVLYIKFLHKMLFSTDPTELGGWRANNKLKWKLTEVYQSNSITSNRLKR